MFLRYLVQFLALCWFQPYSQDVFSVFFLFRLFRHVYTVVLLWLRVNWLDVWPHRSYNEDMMKTRQSR